MIKKSLIGSGMFLVLGLGACGQKPSSSALKDYLYKVSLRDMAANQVYLSDVVDSKSEGVNAAALADARGASNDDNDLNEVTRPHRIQQMVAQLITQLDADQTETLSLPEFMAIQNIDVAGLRSDRAASVENLTALFNQFADQDQSLSEAKLSNLLIAQRGHVKAFRGSRFPNQGSQRSSSAERSLAQFDSNGDGVIDQTEFQAMISATNRNNGGNAGGPGGRGGNAGGSERRGRNAGGDQVPVLEVPAPSAVDSGSAVEALPAVDSGTGVEAVPAVELGTAVEALPAIEAVPAIGALPGASRGRSPNLGGGRQSGPDQRRGNGGGNGNGNGGGNGGR